MKLTDAQERILNRLSDGGWHYFRELNTSPYTLNKLVKLKLIRKKYAPEMMGRIYDNQIGLAYQYQLRAFDSVRVNQG